MPGSSTVWSLDQASLLIEGLDHPECVAVHPDGSIWAGGEAGQIYRAGPDGSQFHEVANTGGFILGIAFSPDASWLLACDVGKKCLWRVDTESGAISLFSRGARSHQFKIPNYASFTRDGRIFVSDSGTPDKTDGLITAFDADHSGNGVVWHDGPFNFANGLCLSPDEDALYVVCSFLPGVERVEIKPDGSPGAREVFLELPRTVPDGLAFDVDGNLYVSCYSPNHIYRVAPDGSAELLLDDWKMHTLSNPTNIAFGGPDFDRMYTANLGRWHITQIETGVVGQPLPCHEQSVSGKQESAISKQQAAIRKQQAATRNPESGTRNPEPGTPTASGQARNQKPATRYPLHRYTDTPIRQILSALLAHRI